MSAPREAGRELDALVAEKVMGWKRGARFGNGNGAWKVPGRAWPTTWEQPPGYSTNIGAAWQVVARMREIGAPHYQNLKLVEYAYSRAYACFDSRAWDDDDDSMWGEGNGEHATPLAICLAALAATESRASAPSPTPQEEET